MGRYLSAETASCDDFNDQFTKLEGEVVYDMALSRTTAWAMMTEKSAQKWGRKTPEGILALGLGRGQKYVRQANGELHKVEG